MKARHSKMHTQTHTHWNTNTSVDQKNYGIAGNSEYNCTGVQVLSQKLRSLFEWEKTVPETAGFPREEKWYKDVQPGREAPEQVRDFSG